MNNIQQTDTTLIDPPTLHESKKLILDEPKDILEILDLDHPGATDPEYMERRQHIATLAKQYRQDARHVPTLEYTENENKTWQTAFEELEDRHQTRAFNKYLYATKKLEIPRDRVPQLKEMSERIKRFNGMTLGPIEGLVDSRSFLSGLADKRMFCTQYVRHHSRPSFTPEPDIIHEVLGHVPTFADADLVKFSQLMGEAAKVANDEQIKQLERLYWFTLEYGMIEENGNPKAFGAGLLAGIEDMDRAFAGDVPIKPFILDEVINQDYNYSFHQTEFFIIPSFEFLKEETQKLLERFNRK